MRWHVKSGDLDAVAVGAKPWDAFLAALKAERPKSLGLIVECTSLDGPLDGYDVWYCATERALRKAGLWGSADAGVGDAPRAGFSWRMFPDCSVRTKAETSRRSSPRWMNSGTVWRGACWMHNSLESPNVGAACSLSAILEARVPPKFFLSPKACRGILRRAKRRGKILPSRLAQALTAVAGVET